MENLIAGQYNWVVSFSKAVFDRAGNMQGVLLIDLNYQIIDRLCADIQLGSRGYIYLLDQAGGILWHPQQDLIYAGLKEENVAEVLAAAEKAQCGEFLARLEHGIHTMAGDGGKQLSGGERQRISLARAILKDAPIVVLDEATAFMDPENEEKMNEAIAEVIRGKTVIVIAHRLHSIVNADQICVLDQGAVADVGTHGELLDRCPAYQKLWQAAEDSAQWGVHQRGGAAQ